MRRSDKASAEAESLLQKAPVCRLGFSAAGGAENAGTDGFPYIVPMHFAWDGENLCVHCAREGEKLRRLTRDNRVCVEIDEFDGIIPGSRPCAFSTRFRSLIAFGRAELVADQREAARALTAVVRKYAGADMAEREYGPGELGSVAILRVRLEEVSVKHSGTS